MKKSLKIVLLYCVIALSYTEQNVLVVDGTVKKEACIWSYYPDKNYGKEKWFYVETDNDGDNAATLMELEDPFSKLSTEN